MSSHIARKRFGQNFLTDTSVIQDIIRSIDPQIGDQLVEIGPGLCALTDPLLRYIPHMSVIEIDRDLISKLEKKYTPNQLTICADDVLKVDFSQFSKQDKRIRVIGNLPYNISSPLLFHLIQFSSLIKDQHFMLQKEVVDRMVAKPGDSEYSRLSVMLQSHYKMYSLFDVPPTAFNPPPKVTSSIVRMIPLGEDRPKAKDNQVFEQIVQQAFSQKRKMLRRSLAQYEIDWVSVGINDQSRPSDLTVQEFIVLSDWVSSSK